MKGGMAISLMATFDHGTYLAIIQALIKQGCTMYSNSRLLVKKTLP